MLDGIGDGREHGFVRKFYDVTCSDGVSCAVGSSLTVRRFRRPIPTLASKSKQHRCNGSQKLERLSASELITGKLPANYPLINRQPLDTAGFAARRVYHVHPEARRNAIGSDETSEAMKRRYLLFRRKRGGMFYLEDPYPD